MTTKELPSNNGYSYHLSGEYEILLSIYLSVQLKFGGKIVLFQFRTQREMSKDSMSAVCFGAVAGKATELFNGDLTTMEGVHPPVVMNEGGCTSRTINCAEQWRRDDLA